MTTVEWVSNIQIHRICFEYTEQKPEKGTSSYLSVSPRCYLHTPRCFLVNFLYSQHFKHQMRGFFPPDTQIRGVFSKTTSPTLLDTSWSRIQLISFSKNIYLFFIFLIFLADSGLSCGMRDLHWGIQDLPLRHAVSSPWPLGCGFSLVVACGFSLLELWRAGSRARKLNSCGVQA